MISSSVKVPAPSNLRVANFSGSDITVRWDSAADDVISYMIKWIPLSGGKLHQVNWDVTQMELCSLYISWDSKGNPVRINAFLTCTVWCLYLYTEYISQSIFFININRNRSQLIMLWIYSIMFYHLVSSQWCSKHIVILQACSTLWCVTLCFLCLGLSWLWMGRVKEPSWRMWRTIRSTRSPFLPSTLMGSRVRQLPSDTAPVSVNTHTVQCIQYMLTDSLVHKYSTLWLNYFQNTNMDVQNSDFVQKYTNLNDHRNVSLDLTSCGCFLPQCLVLVPAVCPCQKRLQWVCWSAGFPPMPTFSNIVCPAPPSQETLHGRTL